MKKNKKEKKIKDYRGMEGVKGRKQKQAVDGLIDLLRTLYGSTPEDAVHDIRVFGERQQILTTTGKKRFRHQITVIDISFVGGTHAAYACAAANLGLLAACESVLDDWHAEPYRPEGWESDIDRKAEAIETLEELCKTVWGGVTPPPARAIGGEPSPELPVMPTTSPGEPNATTPESKET